MSDRAVLALEPTGRGAAVSEPPKEVGRQSQLSGFDAVSVVVAVAMMLYCIPNVYAPYLGPRVSILVLIAPLGTLLLLASIRQRDLLSICAGATLVSAVISSVASPAVAVSLLGTLESQQSTVIMLGGIAAFEIGRRVTSAGCVVLGWAVVASGALSGLVALIQLALVPESGILAMVLNRPSGLAGHAVFFAAHMTAAAAWFAFRVGHGSREATDFLGFAAFVLLGSLSGSRIAIAVPLLLAVLAGVRAKQRRAWLLGPITAASTLLAAGLNRIADLGGSAGERLGQGSEGIADRLANWQFGLKAWVDRPLLGWGPGRQETAASHYVDSEWTIRVAWADAHNIFIETLTTQGAIGLVCVIAFVVFAVRTARGPTGWMCAAVAIGWLLEPAPPATFALALVLLGAATRRPAVARAPSRPALAVALALGAALFIWSTAANVRFNAASRDATLDNFAGLDSWYRFDPKAAYFVAVRNFDGMRPDDASKAMTLTWTRRAAELEPDSPTWQAMLALRYLQSDMVESAKLTAERSLAMQSNQTVALQVLHTVAVRTDDQELETSTRDRLCDIPEGFCPSA